MYELNFAQVSIQQYAKLASQYIVSKSHFAAYIVSSSIFIAFVECEVNTIIAQVFVQ